MCLVIILLQVSHRLHLDHSTPFFAVSNAIAVARIFEMERVKLYSSKQDTEWEDEGTGHFAFDPENETTGFVVTQEQNGGVLLKHKIGVSGQTYTLQEDSRIIRWTDAASNMQYALSFEHGSYCKEVYAKLQQVLEKTTEKDTEESGGGLAEETKNEKALPKLTLANLEMMAKMCDDVQPFTKDQLLQRSGTPQLIAQLVQVFQQCEDLEDLPSLENCCRVARALVIHADFATAEELFCDAHAIHIVGCLEYDPDIPVRIKHREYLKEKVRFKEVMTISNPEIVRRIHRVYRMQYIKDVVLPRLMDEPMFSCLSHMIMVGNIDIVNALSVQSSFFEDLFRRIREQDAGTKEWTDLVGFLQEYCQLLRQLQPSNQLGILVKMQKLGFFSVLTEVLREGCLEMKMKVIDILHSATTQDPAAVRKHIALTPKYPLLQLLLDCLITGDKMGLTQQSLEAIKALMEQADEPVSKFDSFLEIFYSTFIHDLFDVLAIGFIKDADIPARARLPEYVSPRAKVAVVDLLCFCVQSHSYTMKYCILRSTVLDRIMGLLKAREKWLAASAVRFLRTLLGMKDTFYDRIIQRSDVLGRLADLLLENGDRNNLLNSTILEVFDFLKKELRHEHIASVVEQHYGRLCTISYVATFEEIKMEYDKKQEGGSSLEQKDASMMSVSSRPMKRDLRTMDKEEEDYFAEGSDDTDQMPDLSHISTSDMEIEGPTVAATDTADHTLTEVSSHVAKRLRGDGHRSPETVSFHAEGQQQRDA